MLSPADSPPVSCCWASSSSSHQPSGRDPCPELRSRRTGCPRIPGSCRHWQHLSIAAPPASGAAPPSRAWGANDGCLPLARGLRSTGRHRRTLFAPGQCSERGWAGLGCALWLPCLRALNIHAFDFLLAAGDSRAAQGLKRVGWGGGQLCWTRRWGRRGWIRPQLKMMGFVAGPVQEQRGAVGLEYLQAGGQVC